jgi:hypothetical protein
MHSASSRMMLSPNGSVEMRASQMQSNKRLDRTPGPSGRWSDQPWRWPALGAKCR